MHRNTQLLHQSSSQQPLNSALNVPPNTAQQLLQHSNSRSNRQSRNSGVNKEIRHSHLIQEQNAYRSSQVMDSHTRPKHQQPDQQKQQRRGCWATITCGLCSTWKKSYPPALFFYPCCNNKVFKRSQDWIVNSRFDGRIENQQKYTGEFAVQSIASIKVIMFPVIIQTAVALTISCIVYSLI
jgi:DNA primase